MKKNRVWVYLLLIGIAVGLFVVYNKFADTETDIDEPQDIVEVGPRPEYEETYTSFVYTNGVPIALIGVNDEESEQFIEKIGEAKLSPKHMIMVGNELYFTSEIEDEHMKGETVMVYDIVDRKFYILSVVPEEELGNVDKSLTLMAVDVINNKIIFAISPKSPTCDSLWVSAQDALYSLQLYSGPEVVAERYQVPQWKIEEERETYGEC